MPLLVAAVTFVVFTIEALVHYNIGANGERKGLELRVPSLDDGMKVLFVVAVFSIINGFLVKYAQQVLV
jgi:hypothetical protein